MHGLGDDAQAADPTMYHLSGLECVHGVGHVQDLHHSELWWGLWLQARGRGTGGEGECDFVCWKHVVPWYQKMRVSKSMPRCNTDKTWSSTLVREFEVARMMQRLLTGHSKKTAKKINFIVCPTPQRSNQMLGVQHRRLYRTRCVLIYSAVSRHTHLLIEWRHINSLTQF